jgi:hypothetical protein
MLDHLSALATQIMRELVTTSNADTADTADTIALF